MPLGEHMERGERKLVLVVDDEAPIRALVRLASSRSSL